MKKVLDIQGTVLDKWQLEKYLEKIASDHVTCNRSKKDTYPIPRLIENYNIINSVYKLLNSHIKLGIPIHPAGEWLLDNLYIIEECVKNISKELSLKKYINFLGLTNGKYQGFARIYVLASEMVAYTDGKIDNSNLEAMLVSYQNKKSLSMDEIWNIGLFIQIALIENIRQICEKVYLSQMQKYKAEYIIENIIENKDQSKLKNIYNKKAYIKKRILRKSNLKYSFIEYMSYKLKKYGKRAYPYLKILDEEVEKTGNTTDEIIKKEHFDIAVKKVSIGNAINSLKNISRINFVEIFEKINGVEDILKQDLVKQYDLMDANTKILYRNTIKELSKKTKLSEIYIAKKCLELSKKAENEKKKHIGYYLISDGRKNLLSELLNKEQIAITKKKKVKLYIIFIWACTIFVSFMFSKLLFKNLSNINIITNVILSTVIFLIAILPVENIVTKTLQYFLSKIVKPKPIPKLDFQNGVPEEYTTMVVIPTILKNKNQVEKLLKKLEVFYIANKSDNLYFTLLGDCSASNKELEDFDSEIIEAGIAKIQELNERYPDIKFSKFNFIYRKRTWNEKEGKFLGWERKRGLINQFNEYILKNIEQPFRVSTIKEEEIPNIKYVITLDSDTDLTLNSGLELIGAMAHILNTPELSKDSVVDGHALIAPRIGITLENSRQSVFTMLFAGQGGTDSYTNAISDFYQDNFEEGIFAGKGIYDLKIFSKVLFSEIKDNTVLSHDLLEGCYLRSAYDSSIMLMDGYPSSYMSARKRLYRWIRGDYQILWWLSRKIENKNGDIKRNPLNLLSKYKIASNIIRAKEQTGVLAVIVYSACINIILKINILPYILLGIGAVATPFLLDIINLLITKKQNSIKTRRFTKEYSCIKASLYRSLVNILLIPDNAYIALKAEMVTLYRMFKSKKHLLEWETSEEAEKNTKQTLIFYYQNMLPNIVVGTFFILIILLFNISLILKILWLILGVGFIVCPYIMYKIGKKIVEKEVPLKEKDKNFLMDVAYRTWQYFKDTLTIENNFLPPDNYQEDRKQKLIPRTSSTNIGLSLLSCIAAYDLKYETLEDTINLLNNMIETIVSLQKWNGHLYNWYNIETLEPLIPRYISSVDSGNFVGYLYVLLQFLIESKQKIINSKKELNKVDRSIAKEHDLWDENCLKKINTMIILVEEIIKNTDFTKLYDYKNRLFSVGYSIEENKLTDSYYDLLASEARQTSLVAIAKKDISPKHWNNLSRTLTTLNKYKGLISWSGTAFEYLMPNINIPNYKGSILDESCKFLIMSQKAYAKKLGVPWGFSEAAFNLKDLYNNYQYKAFGIPWLGLKRGLADEIVVSSYGTILALSENPIGVLENINILKEMGMYNKYGFYESVDFTPARVRKKYEPVKTYMAHHQGLILLSIDNFFNKNILQKRFMENPQMQSVKILLQERMPENMVITKEEKEKTQKIKYVDYEDYCMREYKKIEEHLNRINVISNEKYTVVIDQYGNGYSKYKNLQINRYKQTDDVAQGVLFYIKDIKSKRIWTNTYSKYLSKPDKYNVKFSPDLDKITRVDGNIETKTKIITDVDEPVEIRRLELFNNGIEEQTLEITSYLEPILSEKMQDAAHKAFNNLFLTFEYIDTIDAILVKRNCRNKDDKSLYMAVKLYGVDNKTDTEFEIDKEKFLGRVNLNLPKMVENSIPLRKKIENVTDPIIALRKIVTIMPKTKENINLIISVSESKDEAIKNLSKYLIDENITRMFEISKARVEAEIRYLGLKGKNIEDYQNMLSYLLLPNKVSLKEVPNKVCASSDLWKYGISGDLPILLVKIKDISSIDTVKECISAYEYYKSKNIQIDLIILNEEKESYESFVKDEVQSAILAKNLGYLINTKAGIYLLNNISSKQDKFILENKAKLTINAEEGTLHEQLQELETSIKEKIKKPPYDTKNEYNFSQKHEKFVYTKFAEEKLKYFNEYGGFSSNGKEYLIKINKESKLPTVWSNILANENFGTLITENMGGYTWKDNSRLKRLTAWNNDQVTDVPSEIIYLKDIKEEKSWSLRIKPNAR